MFCAALKINSFLKKNILPEIVKYVYKFVNQHNASETDTIAYFLVFTMNKGF